MYAWIWRHLPFGRPGRLIGSIGLVAATGALLWYVIFPWAEPLLPFDDVQVTEQDPGAGGGPLGPDPSGGPGVQPAPGQQSGRQSPGQQSPLGENDIPYSTHSNNPAPTGSR